MATIKYRRLHDTAARLRRMEIHQNGEIVAKLKRGSEEIVRVPAGEYSVRARISKYESEPLAVAMAEGEEFTVDFSLGFWAAVRFIFSPKRAINVAIMPSTPETRQNKKLS